MELETCETVTLQQMDSKSQYYELTRKGGGFTRHYSGVCRGNIKIGYKKHV